MTGDGFVVGLDRDALAGAGEVVPVKEHRRQAGQEPVGGLAYAGYGGGVAAGDRENFCLEVAEEGAAGAQHVHGMRAGRDEFERGPQRRREAAEPLQLAPVGREPGRRGEGVMDEEVRDLLVRGLGCDFVDVVSPVVQVVAGMAHRAHGRVAGDHAGKGDRLFGWGDGRHGAEFEGSRGGP